MNSFELKKVILDLINKFAQETRVFPTEIKIHWVHTADDIEKIMKVDIVYQDESKYF